MGYKSKKRVWIFLFGFFFSVAALCQLTLVPTNGTETSSIPRPSCFGNKRFLFWPRRHGPSAKNGLASNRHVEVQDLPWMAMEGGMNTTRRIPKETAVRSSALIGGRCGSGCSQRSRTGRGRRESSKCRRHVKRKAPCSRPQSYQHHPEKKETKKKYWLVSDRPLGASRPCSRRLHACLSSQMICIRKTSRQLYRWHLTCLHGFGKYKQGVFWLFGSLKYWAKNVWTRPFL